MRLLALLVLLPTLALAGPAAESMKGTWKLVIDDDTKAQIHAAEKALVANPDDQMAQMTMAMLKAMTQVRLTIDEANLTMTMGDGSAKAGGVALSGGKVDPQPYKILSEAGNVVTISASALAVDSQGNKTREPKNFTMTVDGASLTMMAEGEDRKILYTRLK